MLTPDHSINLEHYLETNVSISEYDPIIHFKHFSNETGYKYMKLILFSLVTYIFIWIVKIKLKMHFLCLPLLFGKLFLTRDTKNFIILLKKLGKINVTSASGATDKTIGHILVHNSVTSHQN